MAAEAPSDLERRLIACERQLADLIRQYQQALQQAQTLQQNQFSLSQAPNQ